jgi:integrase
MAHQLHGVRILTPREYEALLSQIHKSSLVKLVRVLMLTGMRYEEVLKLKANPDHFSEAERSVWVRSGKLKAKSPERYVPLTEAGTLAVKAFLADKRTIYPAASVMSKNLTSWAAKAELTPILAGQMKDLSGANVGKERKNVYGMSVKVFRRSWENWLLMIYPDRTMDIMKAQGHDVLSSSNHYAGAVFSANDVERIRAYVADWNPFVRPRAPSCE